MQAIIGRLPAAKPATAGQVRHKYPGDRVVRPEAASKQAAWPPCALSERTAVLAALAYALPASDADAAPLALAKTQGATLCSSSSSAQAALQAAIMAARGRAGAAAATSSKQQGQQTAAPGHTEATCSAPLAIGLSKALVEAADAAQDSTDLRVASLLRMSPGPWQNPWFIELHEFSVTMITKALDRGSWSIKPPASARSDVAKFLRFKHRKGNITEPANLPSARKLAQAITGSKHAVAGNDLYMRARAAWTAQAQGVGAAAHVRLRKLPEPLKKRQALLDKRQQQLRQLKHASELAGGAGAGVAAAAPLAVPVGQRRARPADAAHDAETTALEPAQQAPTLATVQPAALPSAPAATSAQAGSAAAAAQAVPSGSASHACGAVDLCSP